MRRLDLEREPGGARSVISTYCGVAIDPNMSMCGGVRSCASDCGDAAKKLRNVGGQCAFEHRQYQSSRRKRAPFPASATWSPRGCGGGGQCGVTIPGRGPKW